jgi:Skp family chaperone for outer membrane proteins
VTIQVIEILKGLATERGFNMVLDRAQVQIFIGDNIDITPEVLKRLDQRLPTVKVNLPAGK